MGSSQSSEGQMSSYGNYNQQEIALQSPVAKLKQASSPPNGAAVAMAKSSKGAAYAYTDGKKMKYDTSGNGMVTVGKGVAYASAGKKNAALAYSSKAAERSGRIGSEDRKAVKGMVKEFRKGW